MSKNHIAVAVALIVVFGIFAMDTSVESRDVAGRKNSPPFSDLAGVFVSAFPTLGESFNSTAAWSVFQDYIAAAKNHDLEKLSALSQKVSEACRIPERRAECNELMDSVYYIANSFKQKDFTNVAYDDKQIVMSTDYLSLFEGAEPTKTVLYFVKNESGEPRVLGLRFCYGADTDNYQCVNTNPRNRDFDKDGWWDDVEAMFR